jgi:hypothetical protein
MVKSTLLHLYGPLSTRYAEEMDEVKSALSLTSPSLGTTFHATPEAACQNALLRREELTAAKLARCGDAFRQIEGRR